MLLEDGKKVLEDLTYPQFMKMFVAARWEGAKVLEIEVRDPNSDKGPNRIQFS